MKYCKMLLAALPALSLIFSACDDKANYVPAEPEPAGCMGVYFDEGDETSFLFIPGTEQIITLHMHRINADAAADVPLIVTASAEGVEHNQLAHFDAGSKDALVEIDCSGLPSKQLVSIKVDIPKEYVSLYAEALYNYEATAIKSQWESANADGSPVEFFFTSHDYNAYDDPQPITEVYQTVKSEMEVLPGAGMLRVKNFLNSGVDMTFALSESPYKDYDGKYRVSPSNHFLTMVDAYESDSYGDSWYNAWFIMSVDEEGEDDYASLSLTRLDGGASEVDYPYIMNNSEGYEFEYSYLAVKSASRKANSVSMGFGGTPLDNNVVWPDYFYIFFTWDGESGL